MTSLTPQNSSPWSLHVHVAVLVVALLASLLPAADDLPVGDACFLGHSTADLSPAVDNEEHSLATRNVDLAQLCEVLSARNGFLTHLVKDLGQKTEWAAPLAVRREGNPWRILAYHGPLMCDSEGVARLAAKGPELPPSLREFIGEALGASATKTTLVLLDVTSPTKLSDLERLLERELKNFQQSLGTDESLGIIATTSESSERSKLFKAAACVFRGDDGATKDSLTFARISQCIGARGVPLVSLFAGKTANSFRPSRRATFDECIADLADKVISEVETMSSRGAAESVEWLTLVAPPRVAVAEMVDHIPGRDFGPLLRLVETQLQAHLAASRRPVVRVLKGDAVRSILKDATDQEGAINSDRLKQLTNKLPTISEDPRYLLITVDFSSVDSGRGAALSGRVFNLASAEKPRIARVVATLQPSEWAMGGQNLPFDATKKAVRDLPLISQSKTPLPAPGAIRGEEIAELREEMARVVERSNARHPMADKAAPFKARIERIDGLDLPEPEFSENKRHLYYKVPQGTKYQIVFETKAKRPLFVRVLVDGLNTLPDTPTLEPCRDGDSFVTPASSARGRKLQAQPVNLSRAAAWYCRKDQEQFVFNGFLESVAVKDNQGKAKLREFVVTDAPASEAWKQGNTNDIGIVTVAVYSPIHKAQSMGPRAHSGTALGALRTEKIDVYSGDEVPGELLTVIQLRYGIAPENEVAKAPDQKSTGQATAPPKQGAPTKQDAPTNATTVRRTRR